MSVLEIKNLKKTYKGGVNALNGVNLSIKTGLYGLLGPNGAGKTTLMRIIATLQEADEGSIFLDELDVLTQKQEVRQILGYLPQEFDVYPKATAYELLDYLATSKGMTDSKTRKEAMDILLEKTNMTDLRNKKLGSFSGGMKQRFGIAQALLNEPKLLIVDEPTAGLDPEERNRFHNILNQLGKDTIVILSTHIVADVTVLCKNMAIINLGEVLVEDSPENIVNRLNGKIYEKEIDHPLIPSNGGEIYAFLAERAEKGKNMIHVYSETSLADGFSPVTPDLEDAYFYYIKRHNLNFPSKLEGAGGG
jgi:ABC-type multidrug transport system ATPase subunit